MAASGSRSEADEHTCYRCNGPIGDAHEMHLTVTHQGVHAERYSGVTRQVCLDCLAAIGMLEFNRDVENNGSDRVGPIDRVIESFS